MKQLLVTMRGDDVSRDARARCAVHIREVLRSIDGKIIGPPGFSTRIAVAAADEPELRARLQDAFIIEDDYVLHSFGQALPIRSAARNQGRWAPQGRRHAR